MATTSTTTEHRGLTELDGVTCPSWAVAFSANGEYLVSGDSKGVRVWRVEDGAEIARMQGSADVRSVAVSGDSKWIATGGWYGEVCVWDAETHKRVISHEEDGTKHGVDFSPDATRLLVASARNKATVWDVPSRKQTQTLAHKGPLLAAKYSPQGHRIATATYKGPIRLYDDDGHLLAEISTSVIPYYNKGLVWLNDHLLVVSDGQITRIDSSAGTVVSRGPVPNTTHRSCIALPKHGGFVAYSTSHTITFWNTSTHTQLGVLERPKDIESIAISPNNRLIAIAGTDNRIAIDSLWGIDTSNASVCEQLIKRGKAFMATGAWKQALEDAERVIAVDPSSPWGYEIKHAASHQVGRYEDAIGAFEMMLSKLAESPDPNVKQLGDQYISLASIRATIRKIVERTIRQSPRVVIDTTTGRLQDRVERASSFESLPVFNELISSMTTRIDYVRIKREVRQYFHYVMFSHKWDENEPLFQDVMQTAVYELGQSPTHDKLQTFCRIVRSTGIKWAWSDTCCINKSDHFVLQEALVAMFKWYEGAILTIVFLRGVHSRSQLGALVRSAWNTRGWTLQEYIASKAVRFYTEDWTLYLDLQIPNHKESPEVIEEMEQATGVSAEQLKALRPGLTSIREKLCLASPRETTHPEDAAYSLLGIFSITGLSAIYGEGSGSLGRLLAHLLAGSGDVSILAWTGESGNFNSCLPAYMTVFGGPATSHLPSSISDIEMARVINESPSFDLDVALSLYDRLSELPAPWFTGTASRMKLPCIAFPLPALPLYRSRSDRAYRVDTPTFGMVEIRTRHDLTRMKTLYLVHPWLDVLLEPEDVQSHAIMDDQTAPLSPDGDEDIPDEEIDDVPLEAVQPQPTLQLPAMDSETRARRFVARLRQPFGALLVTPTGTGRRATLDYKRVAADSLITVRIQENVPLACILDNVRTLDVL